MRRGGTVSGAVSLVVIFCVLCMAVFAALTFATANRERTLAELDALRAKEFYQADAAATEIAAALRAGDRALADELFALAAGAEQADFPAEILYAETEDGTLADYSIPAGGEQRLEVQLRLRDGTMDVLRWKKVYAGSWETDDTIALADIEFMPG